jgi:hypothetical protein
VAARTGKLPGEALGCSTENGSTKCFAQDSGCIYCDGIRSLILDGGNEDSADTVIAYAVVVDCGSLETRLALSADTAFARERYVCHGGRHSRLSPRRKAVFYCVDESRDILRLMLANVVSEKVR